VLKPPGFQLSLHLLGNKSEVSPTVYQSIFNELLSQYDSYTRIFTDGSKNGELVNFLSGRSQNTTGTGHGTSVYRQSSPVPFWLSLVPAKSSKLRPLTVLIAEILCRVHVLLSGGTSVVFMWVSSHVGLAGNSAAINAAKAALQLPVSDLTIPHLDYK